MRTFIAVTLSENLHRYCTSLQEELKKLDLNVKWTEHENMHMTLKFLGETDDNTCEKVKEILKSTVREERCVRTKITEAGAFPRLKYPRVLWVGFGDEEKILENYFLEIEKQLKPLGFPPEKREFKPHLTLGRFRSQKNISAFIKKMESLRIEPLEGYIEKVVFFRSQLTPRGSIYTPLEEIKLSIPRETRKITPA